MKHLIEDLIGAIAIFVWLIAFGYITIGLNL